MEFRVLAVGDVVGQPGVQYLKKNLRGLRKLYHADFCVVNGENANVVGVTPAQADEMLDAGADVLTLGNHTFQRREIGPYLDDCRDVLRPANYAPTLPGRGWDVFRTAFGPIGIVNLVGRCGMDFNPDNPFLVVEKALRELGDVPVLVDFHAEATSEKLAMGLHLDGRVAALWGTHTHVPTADAMVLPKGTGYISDLGMTGPAMGILGIRAEQSIEKFLGGIPGRYEPASGPCKLEGALFTLDLDKKRCLSVEGVRILG